MANLVDVLPKEIWRKIASEHLKVDDLFPFAMACKQFKKVLQEDGEFRLSTGFKIQTTAGACKLSPEYFEWVHETLKKDMMEFRIAPCLGNDIKRALMNQATSHGFVPTLQVFRKEGFEISEHTCFGAAAGGHIETLKWLRTEGCDLGLWSSRGAAFGGQIEVLEWLKSENAAELDEYTCEYAARAGQLETLKWLKGQECPWNVYTCDAAANNGHLEVLQWFQREGFSIFSQSRIRETAAYGGHLNVLMWLKSFGCSWGRRTCSQAASGGHLAVLQWLKCDGAPWGVSSVYSAASLSGHHKIMDWVMHEEGLPNLLHSLQCLSDSEDSDWTYSDGDYNYDEESYTYSD